MTNDVRAIGEAGGDRVDEIDRSIVQVLMADGRIPNNALAEQVGIAPSTCLGRVRSLQERGVIRGFHADVDLTALGLSLQALIAIRLQAHARDQADSFRRSAPQLPGVLALFHMAGSDDYLLHVAVSSSDALREFVLNHLTSHPAVGHAETSLIFERVPGSAVGA